MMQRGIVMGHINSPMVRFAGLLLTSTAIWPAVSYAQSAEIGADEIVVTATRQAQSISRVPISIAAYSQAQMDQQGVRRIDDVARLTPGVQFNRGTFGLGTSVSIRGIASTAGSATTGIYIDDTPIQVRTIGNSSANAYPAVFDLERVEVLRGPQGTLFGVSSQGGTIRFITPSPNFDSLSVYGRSEVAITKNGAPSYEFGVAVGAPIVEDKVAFRVSGFHRRDGGFVDRIPYPADAGPQRAQNDSNSVETTVLRGALAFRPVEGLTITPSLYYQSLKSNDSPAYWVALSDPKNARYVSGNGSPGTNTDWFVMPSLKVDADIGAVSLISNTSYFYRKEDGAYDYRVFNANTFGAGNNNIYSVFAMPGYNDLGTLFNRQSNFTQEVRFQSNNPDSALSWVVGGFYTRNKQRSHQDIQVNRTTFEAITRRTIESQYGGISPYLGRYIYVDNFWTTDQQLAAFGEASLEVFEGFKLIAGVRVAQSKLDYYTDRNGPALNGPGFDEGSLKETPITPRFGISWQVDPANLFYATVAKGNRIGGVNRTLPANTQACRDSLSALGVTGGAPKTYDSDNLWSYEIGAKNRIGPLRIAASAYVIKWKDIIRSVNVPGCGFSFVTNLGEATSRGFDLQVDAQPFDGLQLTAMVGYNKATFDKTFAFAGSTSNVITKGYTLGGNPWTVTLQGQYDFTGPGNLDYYVRSDFTFRARNSLFPSSTYDPAFPALYDGTLRLDPSLYNLNLRAGIKLEHFDISAFVNNATNESPLLGLGRGGRTGQIYTANPIRPLTAGLTLSARY